MVRGRYAIRRNSIFPGNFLPSASIKSLTWQFMPYNLSGVLLEITICILSRSFPASSSSACRLESLSGKVSGEIFSIALAHQTATLCLSVRNRCSGNVASVLAVRLLFPSEFKCRSILYGCRGSLNSCRNTLPFPLKSPIFFPSLSRKAPVNNVLSLKNPRSRR